MSALSELAIRDYCQLQDDRAEGARHITSMYVFDIARDADLS